MADQADGNKQSTDDAPRARAGKRRDGAISGDNVQGEKTGGAGTSPGNGTGPVFKPDTGRDARGSGSHQSGEGGSGNESGSSGSEL